MESYAALKLAHVVSATLLFGTGLGTAFHLWRADRGGDVRAIAAAARSAVLADWLFTLPAVLLQPLTGVTMMALAGYRWSEPWIAAALALYGVAGACWLAVVWLQIRMRDLAVAAAARGEELPDAYRRYMRLWFALGWPAFLAVAVTFYLMVTKPTLAL